MTVIVAAVDDWTEMVAVLEPFFRTVVDEGFATTVHPPDPVPVIGGPLTATLPSLQSAALVRTVVPLTTVVPYMSPEALTEL